MTITRKSERKLRKWFPVGAHTHQVPSTKGILDQQAAVRTTFSQVDASFSKCWNISYISFLLNLPQKALDHDVLKHVPLAFEPLARKIDDQKTSEVLSRRGNSKIERKHQKIRLRFPNVPCISSNTRGTFDGVWSGNYLVC